MLAQKSLEINRNVLQSKQLIPSERTISLQQYFNGKKTRIVTFFQSLKALLHELGLVIQLQIDNQYIMASTLLKSSAKYNLPIQQKQNKMGLDSPSNIQCISQYCQQMKMNQKGLFNAIVQKIAVLAKQSVNNLNRSTQNINSQKYQKNEEPCHKFNIISQKSKRNNEQQTGYKVSKNLLLSNNKTNENLCSKRGLQTISKNVQNLQQPNFNIFEVSDSKTFDKKIDIRSKSSSKQYQPINLLNKRPKREYSASKPSQKQIHSDRSTPLNMHTQPQPIQIQNPSSKIINQQTINKQLKSNLTFVPIDEQHYLNQNIAKKFNRLKSQAKQDPHYIMNNASNGINNQNSLAQLKDLKMTQIQAKQSKMKNNSSLQTKRYNQNNELVYLNSQYENPHQVCQKLDIKIQQSAIQMLNKVKNKRSPSNRKKSSPGYQSISKTNKTNNPLSILQISTNCIPISISNNNSGIYTANKYNTSNRVQRP